MKTVGLHIFPRADSRPQSNRRGAEPTMRCNRFGCQEDFPQNLAQRNISHGGEDFLPPVNDNY